MTDLSNKRVLILATNGFEEAELFKTRQTLIEAGAHVTLTSINKKPIRGVLWDTASGTSIPSDKAITPELIFSEVKVEDFDALMLPGGVVNPDTLRMFPEAIAIIRRFYDARKPVAAICHAPWLLIDAGVVDGRRVTGWPSIRTDLKNAGAQVLDEAVVVDGNLISSRMPADTPAFAAALIRALAVPESANPRSAAAQ